MIVRSRPRRIDPLPLRISKFTGIDQSITPTQLDVSKSPDMLNCRITENYKIVQREGYERVFGSLGNDKINGLWIGELNGTLYKIYGYADKLYNSETQIASGLANAKLHFFKMNNKLYVMNGTDYKLFDGTTVSDVEATAYIPTLTMGRAATGGGNYFEDLNLLSPYFKDSFSPDGTATVYTGSLQNLDATAVTVWYQGTQKTEGTHFTVNRVAGTYDFSKGTSPMGIPAKGTDTLIVQAAKTTAGRKEKIKGCTIQPMLYGGDNDTRVFVANKNIRYYSGLYDPSYWPENAYAAIGADGENITAYRTQYDTQIIEKENSKWYSRYSTDTDGKAVFKVYPLNDAVGTLAIDSIQLLDNNPASLSDRGVYTLVASNVRDERNVQMISKEVNPSLLLETDLKSAVSVDYTKYSEYWLCIGSKVWVYNYRIGAWYPFDNIPASCFFEYDGTLYFGSSNDGSVYKFTASVNDVNTPINAYITTPLIGFGIDEFQKSVPEIYVNFDPAERTSTDIYYRTENDSNWHYLGRESMYLFDYGAIYYDNFSYISSELPQTEKTKVGAKNFVYIQFKFANNNLDETFSLTNVVIRWQTLNYVR